jgi:hypothetical protein
MKRLAADFFEGKDWAFKGSGLSARLPLPGYGRVARDATTIGKTRCIDSLTRSG